MPNVGSLTTVFTAPAACQTATGLYQIWDSSSDYYYEQGPLASMASCFPSGYVATSTAQYFSPGLCPDGYTAACSSTNVLAATATETAVTCCPAPADISYTCAASSIPGQPFLGCATSVTVPVSVLGVTAVSSGQSYSTATVEGTGFALGANSISVRFRAGDFSAENSATTTPSTTAPCALQTSAIATAAASSKRLSTAAIAGIAVGAGGALLVLASSLAIFCWIRKKKMRAAARSTPQRQYTSDYITLPKPPTGGLRHPPPPRPPTPPPLPQLSSLPPPPPIKDGFLWPTSPTSPRSPAAADYFTKLRDDALHKSRSHDELNKKSYFYAGPAGIVMVGAREKDQDNKDRKKLSRLSSTGPFELPGAEIMEDDRDAYELHELYGEGQMSPNSATGLMSPMTRHGFGGNNNGGRPSKLTTSKSMDALQTLANPAVWQPKDHRPSNYSWAVAPPAINADQPAELESPSRSLDLPLRNFDLPPPTPPPRLSQRHLHGIPIMTRHRRFPSARSGSTLAPAELPGDWESPRLNGPIDGYL